MTTLFGLNQRLNKYPYHDRLRILDVYRERLQIMLERDEHPEAAVWIGPMQIEIQQRIDTMQPARATLGNRKRLGYVAGV